jgi:hypothetical protein
MAFQAVEATWKQTGVGDLIMEQIKKGEKAGRKRHKGS